MFLIYIFICLVPTIYAKAQIDGSSKSNNEKAKIKKSGVCARLKINKLFNVKETVEKKLDDSLISVKNNKQFSSAEKLHRLKIIKLFQSELNQSTKSFYSSLNDIQHFLKGGYQSVNQLKEASKLRLEQLKISTVQAEQEFNFIMNIEREEHQETLRANKKSEPLIKKFVSDLIGDVSIAADELELKLNDGSFEQELKADNKISIETVVKLQEEDEDSEGNDGVIMLIDSDSNHYVLSKPKDSTTTHVDHLLLREIMSLLMLSFILILICNLLKMPTMFACVLAGILLGPSGGAYLKSIVQIETFGEFGVFFLLLFVGMEFSVENLKKVFRESAMGILGISVIYLLIGLLLGVMIGIPPRQIIFVTFSLSFSSTPVITKLISSQSMRRDNDAVTTEYSNLLMSMLVLQDAMLGIFMALLPILAGHSERTHSFANVPGNNKLHVWFHGTFGGTWELVLFTVIELTLAMVGIVFVSYVLSHYFAAKFFRGLSLSGSREAFALGILSALFFMLSLTANFGISMELGCFICGVLISTMGEQTCKQVMGVVEPLKDVFSCLFFASIGFHTFPTFVFSEILLFIPITLLVVATKFGVTTLVLHYILPNGDQSKWLVGAGLSQISEFSFVLCSRARRFGLIGREVYLVILSVTTLSLLFAPFHWRYVHASMNSSHGKTWNMKHIIKRLSNNL